jgi:hypothetical protein
MGALAQHEGHPQGEQLPDVHAGVGQQPVHLLHPVLVLGASGLCQRMADGVYRQAGRMDNPQGCKGQRQHSLVVEFFAENPLYEGVNLLLVDG